MASPEGKITSISLTPRHIKYLADIKNEVGISKAELIRRALDLFIGSDQDPLKKVRKEEEDEKEKERNR